MRDECAGRSFVNGIEMQRMRVSEREREERRVRDEQLVVVDGAHRVNQNNGIPEVASSTESQQKAAPIQPTERHTISSSTRVDVFC